MDLLPAERIEHHIYFIRGHKIMLDSDLAELYGVTTGNLNLAVRRNLRRFPDDFMFQLTADEMESLILQTARSNRRGGRLISHPSLSSIVGRTAMPRILGEA